MPTLPGMKMLAGMMPILHAPAVITPGQFGPISRDFEPDSERLTRTMSSTGMPSVMQTISGMSASIASQIASAAGCGGRDLRGDRCGHPADRLHHRRHSGAGHGAGQALAIGLEVAADRAELPRRYDRRRMQDRHH